MVISAILVGLLATCGQWWFFGPITKCLVYPLTTGTLVGVFMGEPYDWYDRRSDHSVNISWMDLSRRYHAK